MMGEPKMSTFALRRGNYPSPEGMVATGLITVSTHEVAQKSDKSLILKSLIATAPILEKTERWFCNGIHWRERLEPHAVSVNLAAACTFKKMVIERHSGGGRRDLRKG